jgi:(2R)-ethylmalonyl-CoA mutase
MVPAVVEGLAKAGASDIPVVVGGIVPPQDAEYLRAHGVTAVFTPKDYDLTQIMNGIVDVVRKAHTPTG